MKSLRCMYKSHVILDNKNIVNIVTPSGEIETTKWMEEVKELSVRNREEEILEKLYQFCRKEIAWLRMRDFKLKKNTDDLEEDEIKLLLKDLDQEKNKYQLKIENESMQLALEYYAMRIWEEKRWIDYKLFNDLYIKGELQLSL